MSMTGILTLTGYLLAAACSIPLAIFALEVIAGLLPGRSTSCSTGHGDVAVLIPAHDEAAGIGTTLQALLQATPANTRILVVADNCTDDTAAQARLNGVEVVERHDQHARGKGHALAFGRDHLASGANEPPAFVVILDADCRLEAGSIEALCTAASARGKPAQAINLIAGDLSAPPMVQISSFAMLVKNLYRSRGMQRLGGAALLTGTGMAFPWRQFAAAELATGSIVEDLALGLTMTRAGNAPYLVETAGVSSAPSDMRDALQQRQRWEHGFLETVKQNALPTVIGGLRRGSLAEFLLGTHLLVPPLALLLMIAGLGVAMLGGLALLGASIVPAAILGALVSLVLVLVFIAWLARGRAYLSAGSLLRIPFYLLWKLPVYIGFVRKPETEWKRTPRRDS